MATPYGPTPNPTAHFDPVELTFTKYERGEAPQTFTELRHMTFNIWAYRQMCLEAGVDLKEMGTASQKLAARRERLVQQHGEKKGMAKLKAEVEKQTEEGGALQGFLPGAEADQFRQIALIVWGALLSEDSGINGGRIVLTVDEIERALFSPEEQARVFEMAVNSLMRYLYGTGLNELAAEAKVQEAEQAADAGGEAPDPTEA